MARYTTIDVKILFDEERLNDAQKQLTRTQLIAEIIKLKVKMALLGNIGAVQITADEWNGYESKELDLTPGESTFVLESK